MKQREKGAYWRMIRPHTLTASFIPVLLGTFIVVGQVELKWGLFLAMLIASVLIQIATNLFNEYYDYKRGLDHEGSIGIGGSIVRDGFTPGQILGIALGMYGVAAALGLYIAASTNWHLLWIGALSMVVGYLYTGGPLPIAYTPFGELVAGLFMGYVIIGISGYIQVGTVTTELLIVSFPMALLIGAILLANNIRDLDNDKENGRRTIACLVGHRRAVLVLAGFFVAALVGILVGVFVYGVTPWVLLSLFTIPLMVRAVKRFWVKREPVELMPAMAMTAKVNTLFGAWMVIGLMVARVIT
ncbi:1,4-dihydroxy-2-naphthoate polyprenyltransferase [Exiguobacterium alkaliphilum]|uniref:1,4-dihydroxy-2-naphthoate octaprenyltransferase n=1 Tax=Exiguobacterium alkaliphilum TaxID=1428684 RepID=A0ABT2KWV5_9BACL|nr:1,4-dihydroxy-2-naphthoate polyprenyltransferase [Exiguobacterium alkaliphilum]MCT4794170.1 1,4-dihydroxy-2-naphthoate polyprenyltransferase [Exiguobacterium alkaliphilum]